MAKQVKGKYNVFKMKEENVLRWKEQLSLFNASEKLRDLKIRSLD